MDAEEQITQVLKQQAEFSTASAHVGTRLLVVSQLSGSNSPSQTSRSRRGTYAIFALITMAFLVLVLTPIIYLTGSSHHPAPASPPAALSGTSIPLSTNTWHPGDGGLDMGIRGTVKVSENKCVYLGGLTGEGVDVIWPADWTARMLENGQVLLYDPDGRIVVRTGDQIDTSGGGISSAEGDTLPHLECHATASHQVVSISGTVVVVH